MNVTLREITKETVRTVCKLDAGHGDARDASNAVSIAEAHFHPGAWFRAIYADDVPVGVIMLDDPTLAPQPEDPDLFQGRLMIDSIQRGRGCRRSAVRQLVEHVRSRPRAQRLLVSQIKPADRVGRCYEVLGSSYTGVEVDNEPVLAHELA